VFRTVENTYRPRTGVNWLRAPDHSSRCDELTDEQRKELATRIWTIWNLPQLVIIWRMTGVADPALAS